VRLLSTKSPSSLQNTIIENFVASSSFLFIATTLSPSSVKLKLENLHFLVLFLCSLGFLRGLVP